MTAAVPVPRLFVWLSHTCLCKVNLKHLSIDLTLLWHCGNCVMKVNIGRSVRIVHFRTQFGRALNCVRFALNYQHLGEVALYQSLVRKSYKRDSGRRGLGLELYCWWVCMLVWSLNGQRRVVGGQITLRDFCLQNRVSHHKARIVEDRTQTTL